VVDASSIEARHPLIEVVALRHMEREVIEPWRTGSNAE
jgi:hypothetical protein